MKIFSILFLFAAAIVGMFELHIATEQASRVLPSSEELAKTLKPMDVECRAVLLLKQSGATPSKDLQDQCPANDR